MNRSHDLHILLWRAACQLLWVTAPPVNVALKCTQLGPITSNVGKITSEKEEEKIVSTNE